MEKTAYGSGDSAVMERPREALTFGSLAFAKGAQCCFFPQFRCTVLCGSHPQAAMARRPCLDVCTGAQRHT